MSGGQRAAGLRLDDEQRLAWLRLIRSENIGPVGIMAQTPRPTGEAEGHIPAYGREP